MDQCRSRLKLSENFERHWSIRISVGKFIWTNGPESSSKVSPYTGIGPWMALPSLLRPWTQHNEWHPSNQHELTAEGGDAVVPTRLGGPKMQRIFRGYFLEITSQG